MDEGEEQYEDQPQAQQRRQIEMAAPTTINVIQAMEVCLEKMKLLNYEANFCRARNMKPLTRTYFAMPSSNPSEQLYTFTSLVHWLLTQLGAHFDAPEPHDNPNAVAGVILQQLRQAGLPSDFPPAKVKQGQGEAVLQILESVCDAVLEANHFSWARPAHKADEYDDEAEVDDEAELDGGIDDEAVVEEEEGLYMDGLASPGFGGGAESPGVDREILESAIPAAQWKMELERVAPQLKAIQSVDHKEWRAHLEQTKTLSDKMVSGVPKSREALSRLSGEVSDGLEEIQKSERRMNSNFEHLLSDFKNRSSETVESKQQYEQVLGVVSDLTNNLQSISEELDEVKNKMEDRGSSMTDTSPVITMKKSLTQVKQDSKLMDIRIGVAQHALLQARLAKHASANAKPIQGFAGLQKMGDGRRDSMDDEMYD
eukprot:TRINITY_DN508_c0_g2_i1.p1 TRINITY_DN508_c0_g2~~TRINITY_DN508_c0_g2_i1.p1  ORF type:complete len:427 (+),score=139.43 TRINITY_DN508_c0_g2_i1:60-1340(+)